MIKKLPVSKIALERDSLLLFEWAKDIGYRSSFLRDFKFVVSKQNLKVEGAQKLSMLKEAQNCPKCLSQRVWSYGSRRKELRVLKKLLCPACGHVWEIEVSEVRSVSPELVKPIMKLMERVIGDAERGVSVRERGWVGFDAETAEALLETRLCERDWKTGKIRVVPSAELPEDLAALETAKIFLDVRKAEKIAKELEDVWRGQGRYEAVMCGLRRMLESGVRTVSPVRLARAREDWKMCSSEWFSLAHQAVNSLVLIAVEEMWKDRREKVERARELLGDMVRLAEDVEKVLRWRDVVGKLGREALEALGFLWFADRRLGEIESSVGKRVAQRELLAVIGPETPKKIEAVLAETGVSYVNFPWW